MATMTARQFNQDLASAKRDAANEPVFITDRGEPKFVLLSIEQYNELSKPKRNLHEILRMSEEDYFEYDFDLEGARNWARPREVDLHD